MPANPGNDLSPEHLGLATRAIHGRRLGPQRGTVAPPLAQTSTYRFADSGDALRYAEGDPGVYVYSRYHNPTVDEAQERLALLAGTESALLLSSGMAAITSAILSTASAGDEIVTTPQLYGGTYRWFRDVLPGMGITVRTVDPGALGDIDALLTPRTRLLYTETPTNPTLDVVDLDAFAEAGRRASAVAGRPVITIVDNTFATLLNQNPLRAGVDAVVESATKYLGGHSDLMGGVVYGTRAFVTGVHRQMKYLGGCADPFAAWLLLRSLATFELRVSRQNANALALARFLEGHRDVVRVLYPGLPSHPGHGLAARQMPGGFGGMVTIEVKGGAPGAVRMVDGLRVAVNAMSLGGVETLASIPVYSSHVNMSEEELRTHRVAPGMVRISVGIEALEDLTADFDRALARTR